MFFLCSLSASNLTAHTQIYRTSTCKWTFFREMIAACLKNVKNRDPTDYHRWLDGNFGMRAHDKHVKNSMRRVFFFQHVNQIQVPKVKFRTLFQM